MQRQRPTRNDRLRHARESRNLTQADVARRLGSSTLTISRWELGVQSPQPHHREQLCRLYGVSAHDLGLAVEAPAPAAPPAPPAAEAGETEATGDERARRDLLTQVRRYWVGGQLEARTGGLSRLELRLVERPRAVDDPRSVVGRSSRADVALPAGMGIGEAYRRLGEQLLILGEPGAGKTTLLLQLLRELLEDGRRAAIEPMPVIFHLASWASERRPLRRWLVDELHSRYGVARRIAQRWIAAEQVLPLLDGLDEVADRHRVACVAAINQFRREHGQLPMVVCCRTAWYESAAARLSLRGAIAILPLTQAEVRRALDAGGEELAGLRQLVEEDEQLRELLTTPVFLSIAAVAYRDRPAAGIDPGTSLAERRRHLLGDYVDAVLTRASPRSPLPRERTMAWLGWLAGAMRAHDQSVFYLDWIQPSWLPKDAHPWLVTRGVTVACGLASGLLLGVNWGVDWGLSLGLGLSLLAGITIGSLMALAHGIVAHESRIVPAGQMRWSWPALRRGLAAWIGIGLSVGLLGGFLFGLVVGFAFHLRPEVLSGVRSAGAVAPPAGASLLAGLAAGTASGVVNGTAIGLVVGLAFGLLTGLDTRSGITDMAPGESVEASGSSAILGGLLGGTMFWLGYGLIYGQGTSLTGPLVHQAAHALGLAGVYWPVAAPNDLVVAAFLGALIAGLQRGGGAYLRHRALMWMLVRSGRAPRDYVAFLEYCSRLVLLRRRGGGYEFIHRTLLEHFAESAKT